MNISLHNAYEAAIQQQARSRNRSITSFDRQVSESIFEAGVLAIEDSQQQVAQYRVVSAPTGSGKTSYAQAFIKAYVETQSSASVLYLVETVCQAEAIYKSLSGFVGRDKVAVWTTEHDPRAKAEKTLRKYGFVPEHRFAVDDLGCYPVVVATQSFYKGSRSDKATRFRGSIRQITFIDEQPQSVSIFDVDTGLIKVVRDRLAEEYTSACEAVRRLTQLHDYAETIWRTASGKSQLDTLPRSPDIDLDWFTSAHTSRFLASPDDQVRLVFGFGRALARGFAFLVRYDQLGNGARFVGYDMNMPLTPGTIVLDATANIDGLSLIAKNRKPVAVPQVDFRNLTITHIDPEPLRSSKGRKTLRRVSEVTQRADLAQPYGDWILATVMQHTEPGEQVLVTVHKALLDHQYLPIDLDRAGCAELDGRRLCFIHWGIGIGSNDWRHANAVFLFDEFHKPRQATVATGLGLQEERASKEALQPFQAANRKNGPHVMLKNGDLCRWLKQIAMRGNARNIDANGVCGVQRLYVTGALDRLLCYAELMFPGADIALDQPQKRLSHGGTEALIALLFCTQDVEVTTSDVKRLTGVNLQKNQSVIRSRPEVQAAERYLRRGYVSGGGRGKTSKYLPSEGYVENALPLLPDLGLKFDGGCTDERLTKEEGTRSEFFKIGILDKASSAVDLINLKVLH